MGAKVVVADFRITFSHAEADGVTLMYAAREEHIGVTGYGPSRNDAVAHLLNVIRTLFENLEKRGILEKKLDEVQVKWRWADPDTEWPTEFPSLPPMDAQRVAAGTMASWRAISESSLITDSHIPIAA